MKKDERGNKRHPKNQIKWVDRTKRVAQTQFFFSTLNSYKPSCYANVTFTSILLYKHASPLPLSPPGGNVLVHKILQQ
jgi:hypothetical protein